jgi:hypothetical protein
MGKMGNTWRGVETITNTGETDQGVTNMTDRKLHTIAPRIYKYTLS